MLLLTLRGTPTIYQGEELGVQDAPMAPEHIQDPWEKNVPGLGLGRDPKDTDALVGRVAGRIQHRQTLAASRHARNRRPGAAARRRPSMLSLYRALLGLRRAEPALAVGSYSMVAFSESVLVYERQHDAGKFQIALNMATDGKPCHRKRGVEKL
jgi:alpha-glucosidase